MKCQVYGCRERPMQIGVPLTINEIAIRLLLCSEHYDKIMTLTVEVERR